MDIRKLQRAIVDGLEDVKAQNIQVFNTEHLSALFERVIVASGTSNRQTKSLAASVRDSVRASGLPVMRTEGEENGEWIIVDCGAAVAHIMQPAIREYYHLEELWGGKAVKMKYGEAKVGLVKAAEPEPKAKPKRAVEPARARSAAGKAATKPAAKKTVKTVATRKPVEKSDPGKKIAATKLPARRPAASATRATSKTASGATPKPAARATAKSPARAAPKPAVRSASSSKPTARGTSSKPVARAASSKATLSKKAAGAKTSSAKPAAKPATKKPTRRA